MNAQDTQNALDTFIKTNKKIHDYSVYSSVHEEMQKRWVNRVVKNGWHLEGAEGADKYLAKYGKGIQTIKLIHLAIYASKQGDGLYARRLWEKAMEIDTVNKFIHNQM